MTDEGSLLFPSITVCKDEMFENERYSDRGLLTRLQSGEVSTENASSWFRNRTFSRARLVKFLSIKTVEGSNKYPCNAVSGPREGEPCSFPFFYPDCKLMTKVAQCQSDPGIVPEKYRGCYTEDTDNPWCYTRLYYNRSHIKGQWGYCSQDCSKLTERSVSLIVVTNLHLQASNSISSFLSFVTMF